MEAARRPRRCLALLLLGALALGSAPARAEVLRDVPYRSDPADPESQSLDLYMPEGAKAPPPLVAFVNSRFWSERGDDHDLGLAFARPLVERGVAVAIVRHRLAPAHVHPEQVEDVAAALAFLLREAGRYGYDPKQLFVAGQTSGAHLATLVALDPRYLAEAGASASDLAGVIAISGVFDLTDTENTSAEEQQFVARAFPSEKQRREASPVRLVRADAPPFLVIAAGDDIPSVFPEAKAFTDAMRAAGGTRVEGMLVKGTSHFSILDLRPSVSATRESILAFVAGKTPVIPPAPSG